MSHITKEFNEFYHNISLLKQKLGEVTDSSLDAINEIRGTLGQIKKLGMYVYEIDTDCMHIENYRRRLNLNFEYRDNKRIVLVNFEGRQLELGRSSNPRRAAYKALISPRIQEIILIRAMKKLFVQTEELLQYGLLNNVDSMTWLFEFYKLGKQFFNKSDSEFYSECHELYNKTKEHQEILSAIERLDFLRHLQNLDLNNDKAIIKAIESYLASQQEKAFKERKPINSLFVGFQYQSNASEPGGRQLGVELVKAASSGTAEDVSQFLTEPHLSKINTDAHWKFEFALRRAIEQDALPIVNLFLIEPVLVHIKVYLGPMLILAAELGKREIVERFLSDEIRALIHPNNISLAKKRALEAGHIDIAKCLDDQPTASANIIFTMKN